MCVCLYTSMHGVRDVDGSVLWDGAGAWCRWRGPLRLRLVCRPSKREVEEYVGLTDHAAHLHAKVQDTCMQSQQFAERLVTGAVVAVDTGAAQSGPAVAVVLGLEAAIKVLFPYITACFLRATCITGAKGVRKEACSWQRRAVCC